MFGDEIGVYSRSCVFKLCLRVNFCVGKCSDGCAPLLDRRNEIVVGIVTSVVMVRMKNGKNCPCARLETVGGSEGMGAPVHRSCSRFQTS
jgi:hypothetical protein